MGSVLIVGTVSNVSHAVEKDLLAIVRALDNHRIAGIHLVESDSVDDTVRVLEDLRTKLPNFTFQSYGVLSVEIPDRISRIRYCRNQYVGFLRENFSPGQIDYVLVADLDGMNSSITAKGIDSCFQQHEWSGVFANQRGGYYDLLALRHDEWCPRDIFEELRELQSSIKVESLANKSRLAKLRMQIEFDKARKQAIYSKMKRIPESSDWIPVRSAFGGLAVYKARIFYEFDYGNCDFPIRSESEHVYLNSKLFESGAKLFINPRMINNFWNTYNINRFFLIRQLRQVYWNSKRRQTVKDNLS